MHISTVPVHFCRSRNQIITVIRIDSLPDCRPLLQNVRIKHPIEQNMLGRSGLFRQQNIERRRVYSLREWFEVSIRSLSGTDKMVVLTRGV